MEIGELGHGDLDLKSWTWADGDLGTWAWGHGDLDMKGWLWKIGIQGMGIWEVGIDRQLCGRLDMGTGIHRPLFEGLDLAGIGYEEFDMGTLRGFGYGESDGREMGRKEGIGIFGGGMGT